MQQLLTLYRLWKGAAPASTERLAGAGSNRAYYRLTAADGSGSVIGCVGTSAEENRAFIALARHFAGKRLPVPQVLAVSDDHLRYLQTDLGHASLYDALSQGRARGGQYGEDERRLLRRAVALLPRLQFTGAEGLDFSVCYPQPAFDETGVMFDLNYFKYCFLKPSGVDFHEVRLEEDFRQLAKDLTADHAQTFLYRDFQARNIMLVDSGHASALPADSTESDGAGDRLALIDFQGGRRGPVYYDLASFLWQASARYPDALREELVTAYYDAARRYGQLPAREPFDRRLRLFVLFRTMQVLGAYGYRGYFERKQHFIDSIPPAIDNLRQTIGQADTAPYPYLTAVLARLCEAFAGRERQTAAYDAPGLHVTVCSFSYKRGLPADPSGHGGGYIFDCRGTNNPGRYDAYRHLTGLDAPVIRFLEDDGEILTFLESVYRLADTHVQRYIDRGFTHLMFAFGCTGGQHRSVYSAQHLAEHIRHKFPTVHVHLHHREQAERDS